MKVELRDPAATAQRRARTVAAVGAAVAIGTAGLMVLAVGTAAADEPGRCNETVNVRAEPDLASPIVGVCPAGTAVQIGEIREGYLYLTDYAGWAAWEYLTIGGEPTDPDAVDDATPVDGAAPVDPATTEPTSAATTVIVPDPTDEAASAADSDAADPLVEGRADAFGSQSPPSTTPTADPTPGT